MALSDRFNKLFGIDDETDQTASDHDSISNADTTTDNRVNTMDDISGSKSQIALFEPRIFSDAKEAAKQLISGQAVILNFERIDDNQTKRIVDFLSGTLFAIDGSIEEVGTQIFLCTPNSFEINGSLYSNIQNGDLSNNDLNKE
ncbi:FtsZ-interacting protein related to cell division [Pediococcus damnosus]|uniref:Cell division protein SepF n=1 Tax=Pediococcus damnosus TaxID=51663 RepID=A0A0R2HTK0_9LACO|nr:cell division protein SepF [Pediococcus damnosus]AMV59845.1 FtsZ-interacting protein related to cell division [Pediococcus damnosus]AMV61862.1 FtsZ-interacting protein related to cell division [Pediococcus damnosus]AMV64091.1 FtsZ-interacting protein related to cell division [Pediococcus damnosus]AMV66263.1 FtsZ-interacting protein related to cell division [Pediococcus damnosus]AMV68541.1 FtsZ-interacting protein related to cell division [Pediococcus damnosus]